jgi:hypothetical protein
MPGIKITDLPAVTQAELTDVFPVDQLPGPVTYKESNSQLLTLFKANGEALTRTNDTNITLTLTGTPATALLNDVDIAAGWTGVLALSRGGTNKNLTADNGAIVYCDADSFELLAATDTAQRMLQSGVFNAPSWSTATYPSTTTANEILYSLGNDNVTGLATQNGAVLTTTDSGIPGMTVINDGQLVIGATGGTPLAANLTAGTGIVITNAANSITIESLASGTINPGTINDIAYYSATGDAISPIPGANGAILVTDSAGVPSMLANPGATGTILQSVSGDAPSWSTATYPSSVTVNTILYASSTNVVDEITPANRATMISGTGGVPAWSASMANGEIIIGASSGAPAVGSITAGTGISVTNAANSITIAVTGGGLATATISGTSQSAAVNTTYIALNASQTTLNLPSTYAVGDIIRLVGSTANIGGWVVDAPAGDTIRVNNDITTSGGTVTSPALAGQVIELICDVANTSWVMTSTVSTILTTA